MIAPPSAPLLPEATSTAFLDIDVRRRPAEPIRPN
jgi:hypothetical protein